MGFPEAVRSFLAEQCPNGATGTRFSSTNIVMLGPPDFVHAGAFGELKICFFDSFKPFFARVVPARAFWKRVNCFCFADFSQAMILLFQGF